MPPISTPVPRDVCQSDVRACIRAARPDLAAETPAFRAAVVLLAGPRHGFNIDRMARRYDLPRPWVAACVRRLVDNGVWAGGTAACAWRDADDPRFWNDAAVAEGRLQRRAVDQGVEWAPPGRWEKAYDFVGPQSQPGGPVLYLDIAPRDAPGPCPAGPAAAASAAAAAEADSATPAPAAEAVNPAPLRIEWGTWLGVRDPSDARVPVGAGGGPPDLFPEADWLR